jgi:hypothetical protein
MVPDVIGAQDSAVDIVDGWVDRVGEIRKRGAKALVATVGQTAARPTPGSDPPSIFGAVMHANGRTAITIQNLVINITDRVDWFIWNQIPTVTDWPNPVVTSAWAGGGNSWTSFGSSFVNAGRFFPNTSPAGWMDSSGVVHTVTVPAAISASGLDEPVFATAVEAHAGRVFYGVGAVLRWTSTVIDPAPGENVIDSIYPGATLELATANQGQITDMHSIGESLIIVCENGILSLNGDVATDGTYLGARIDTLAVNNGARSFSGSTKSNIGVVWGNRDGLWVTNGSSVSNLIDGSALVAWSRLMTNDLIISSVGNRIIAQDFSTGNTFIYHIDGGYFVRQGCPVHSQIVEYHVDTELNTPNPKQYREICILADIDFTIIDPDFTYEISVVDWNFDFDLPQYINGSVSPTYTARTNDPGSTTSPRLSVLTQPLDPGYPFTDNRMNMVLLSGHMRDNVDPASLQVSLVGGRGSFIDELESNVVLEYGFTSHNVDTTERISIDGIRSTPASRVLVEEIGNPALDISIYGIGAEFLEESTYGNDS